MRPTLLRILNALLYGLGLGLLLSGGVMHWTLPRGSARRGWTCLGWDRHQWGDLHAALSLAFTLGLALHLWLHWGWVRACFRGAAGDGGKPARAVLFALAALPVLAVLLPLFWR